MDLKYKNVEWYVDKINRKEYFSFLRFGDGEWNAIQRKKGHNCDKHEYYRGMGKRLKAAAKKGTVAMSGEYVIGWQTETDLLQRKNVQEFVGKQRIVDADVFHKASEAGELRPIVDVMRKKHVCFVGPKHLRLLKNKGVPYKGFVEIPSRNCYLNIAHIEQQIREYATYVSNHDVLYAISASMAAEVIIADLYDTIGKENWMIDYGSLWDVYAGKLSRGYHRRITAETIYKNVGVL